MATIIDAAREALHGRTIMSHAELIPAVCAATGNSYESVRGTLIKRTCGLFRDGWYYKDGHIHLGKEEAIVTNYTSPEKQKNWDTVRAHLPHHIDSLVTLGGVNGTDIRTFLPDSAVSYDYDEYVLAQLKRNMSWVETIQGDIFDHTTPSTVLNLDLTGYMCGSRFQDFQDMAAVGHDYIVITIQGQVGGFRNGGEWKKQAERKYQNRDKNLQALKDAMQGYTLLLNRFYRRDVGARKMRTTVWKAN